MRVGGGTGEELTAKRFEGLAGPGSKKRWLTLALSVGVLFAASGCGSPESTTPTSGPLIISTETQAPVSSDPPPGPLIIWSEEPTPLPATESEPSGGPSRAASPGPAKRPASEPTRTAPKQVDKEKAARKGSAGDGPAALAQLSTLPVKGRAPKTGYERARFGSGWKDPDHNGCDGRNDILRRDLTVVVARPGTQGCVIESGLLDDPYTGKIISFVRGQRTSTAVQIDHVVALSDAWQKGAQLLSEDQRLQFANDPLNLLAVDGPANASKGDGDAATWLPPRKSFRCAYAVRQTAVKAKYGLWVTQAEHDALEDVITRRCA